MIKIIVRDSKGNVINIGEWDLNIQPIVNPDVDKIPFGEIKEMHANGQDPNLLYDENDNPVTEITNPMPVGATQKEEQVAIRADGGLAAMDAYQSLRQAEYPPIQDQLDDIYHNGIAGWKSNIKKIKDKYPKS